MNFLRRCGVLSVLAAAQAGVADEVSWYVQEDFKFWRGSDLLLQLEIPEEGVPFLVPGEEDREVLESRLELGMSWKQWRADFRFDALQPFYYSVRPLPAPADYTEAPTEFVGLRKAALEYDSGHSRYTTLLRVGSVGAQFARGLALKADEAQEVGVDRELDGVLLNQSLGDDASLEAIAGIANYLAFEIGDDYAVPMVAGAEARWFGLDWLDWGLGAVGVRSGEEDTEYRNLKAFNSLSLFTEHLDAYVATVANWAETPTDDEEVGPGFGIYSDVTLSLPWFDVRAEYKFYNLNEEHQISSDPGLPWTDPPTLRPIHSLETLNRKSFTANPNNEVGFAVTVEGELGPGAASVEYVLTSYNHYIDLTTRGEIWRPWPRWEDLPEGFPASANSSNPFEELAFSYEWGGGERWAHSTLVLDITSISEAPRRKEHTAGWINEFEFDNGYGVNVQLEYQRVSNGVFRALYENPFYRPEAEPGDESPVFQDLLFSFEVSPSSDLGAYVRYEATNEGGLQEEIRFAGGADRVDDHYLAAGARFRIPRLENNDFHVSVGRTRGGVVCVGGVCQRIDTFEGVKLEWNGRFN